MTRVRITGGYLNIGRRRDRWGRPVDPDYGVDEGDIEDSGEHPDQGGPEGGWGGQRPIDPGFGRPGWGGFPDRPSQGPVWGGRPDRPDQGLPGGPIRPIDPGSPDNSLPPGTIVPPLPPDLDLSGKAYLSVNLVYQGQRHHHHIIVTIPETKPNPPAGGAGGTPPQRPTPSR